MSATTYLLDSDIIIDALRGKRGRARALGALIQKGGLLACCAINVAEVCAGMRPNEETRTRAFLESLEYLDITRATAEEAGRLKRRWAQKGVTLGLADVTVAAVALAHGARLITGNLRHYPMADLRMFTLPEAKEA